MTHMIQVSLLHIVLPFLLLNEALFSADTFPKKLNDYRRDSCCVSRLNYYNIEKYLVKLFVFTPIHRRN